MLESTLGVVHNSPHHHPYSAPPFHNYEVCYVHMLDSTCFVEQPFTNGFWIDVDYTYFSLALCKRKLLSNFNHNFCSHQLPMIATHYNNSERVRLSESWPLAIEPSAYTQTVIASHGD